MDSLTQIVLGAAVGEALMGRKIGNKAQIIGAIAGTIPDLDVLTNLFTNDEVLKLQIHRSYSHATFVHFFLAIPFAYLCYVIFKKKYSFKEFYSLWFWGLFTHAILDCFTTYGTQMFQPFSNYLVGFNNISVVDPLYTLPFLLFLGACLFIKKENPLRFRFLKASLIISCSYMLLTFGFKYHVHNTFEKALKEQHISYNSLSTSPTIFNNFLWAGVIEQDSNVIFSEYSILQKSKTIEFHSYPKNEHLKNNYKSPEMETLLWFSQGKYMMAKGENDTLNFYVTKWGRQDFTKKNIEESFRFYYKLYKNNKGTYSILPQEKFKKGELNQALTALWNRIFNY
jgi:inner membrane protein